jgi:hypothetical protein
VENNDLGVVLVHVVLIREGTIGKKSFNTNIENDTVIRTILLQM